MLNFKNQQLCNYLLKHYGSYPQLLMLLEETSELQQAACKIIRNGGENPRCTDNFKEELADVMVMIEQVRMMFGISDREINDRALEKLKRAVLRSHTE